MENGIRLIIEKGEPQDGNMIIAITKDEYLLGRPWRNDTPDVAFMNYYVSRKHALISRKHNEYIIVDLSSKHGTEVNGVPVTSTPHFLRDGDRISLAKGAVEMLFQNELEQDLEYTMEFTLPFAFGEEKRSAEKFDLEKGVAEKYTNENRAMQESQAAGLVIHPERREICIDGETLFLSSKDIDLLLLLHSKMNQAVSYDEIKVGIWPERSSSSDGEIPDVGRDEINALVYRLRKRLGKYGRHIITILRYGYMLDL